MELTIEEIKADHKYNLQVGGWARPEVVTFLLAELDKRTPSPSSEHVECLCSDCMEDAEISDIEHTDKATSSEKVIAAVKEVIQEHNNVLGETLYDKYTSVFRAVAVLSRELAAYQKESE